MSSWHKVDAHDLSVIGVPVVLICFLRVISRNLCPGSTHQWMLFSVLCLREMLETFVPFALSLSLLHPLLVWKAV